MLENGVWRTIGGRRVFIKNGQDLKTAMKKSGKFGKRKRRDDEEEISKREFNEASKIDNELDRAIQMQVADDIGKEIDDDDIRFRAEHYIRHNYRGNASTEEIYQKLKSEYKNRGVYKEKGQIETQQKEISRLSGNTRQAQIEYDKAEDKYEHYKYDDNSSEYKQKYRQEYNEAKDKLVKASREEDEHLAKLSSQAISNDIKNINRIAGSDEKLQRIGKQMGLKSFTRWHNAYNQYKKEHPETKLSFYEFLKINGK